MARKKWERELTEERQERAREMNKSYERWFQDMQAIFLTNLTQSFGAQQLFAMSLSYPAEAPLSLPR